MSLTPTTFMAAFSSTNHTSLSFLMPCLISFLFSNFHWIFSPSSLWCSFVFFMLIGHRSVVHFLNFFLSHYIFTYFSLSLQIFQMNLEYTKKSWTVQQQNSFLKLTKSNLKFTLLLLLTFPFFPSLVRSHPASKNIYIHLRIFIHFSSLFSHFLFLY